ncbi:MAG: hypothetical protein PWQ84_1605 [Thermotogaceae bacterium]|nr:hypothetical protein [Thermotogaceae bacterium]
MKKNALITLIALLTGILFLGCTTSGTIELNRLNGRYIPVDPQNHPFCMDSFSHLGLYFKEGELYLPSTDFLGENYLSTNSSTLCVMNSKLENNKLILEKIYENDSDIGYVPQNYEFPLITRFEFLGIFTPQKIEIYEENTQIISNGEMLYEERISLDNAEYYKVPDDYCTTEHRIDESVDNLIFEATITNVSTSSLFKEGENYEVVFEAVPSDFFPEIGINSKAIFVSQNSAESKNINLPLLLYLTDKDAFFVVTEHYFKGISLNERIHFQLSINDSEGFFSYYALNDKHEREFEIVGIVSLQ